MAAASVIVIEPRGCSPIGSGEFFEEEAAGRLQLIYGEEMHERDITLKLLLAESADEALRQFGRRRQRQAVL